MAFYLTIKANDRRYAILILKDDEVSRIRGGSRTCTSGISKVHATPFSVSQRKTVCGDRTPRVLASSKRMQGILLLSITFVR